MEQAVLDRYATARSWWAPLARTAPQVLRSIRSRLSVEQLLAAKAVRPIRSLDEFAADTFESDEELEHRRKLTGQGGQFAIQ